MALALHGGAHRSVDVDVERVGNRLAELHDVGNPIADLRDVERTSGHHVGLEAVLLRFLQRARELKHLAEGEVRLDGIHDFLDDGGQVRDDGGRRDFFHDRLHELLLALDAPDVALFVAVAHVGHGRLAVHVLHAGLEIDEEAAVVVPRIFVVHALLHVDVDAAQGVDDALEGVRVDDDVVVDAYAQEVFDRSFAEFVSAVGVSGVDLVVAVPLDFHARVARHGEERSLVLLRVDHCDHQGVGAADVVFPLVDAHDHDG